MTLRVRLTVYYTLFFASTLLLMGAGLYLIARRQLLNGMAHELEIGSAWVTEEYRVDPRVLADPDAINPDRLRPATMRDPEAPDLLIQVADLSGKLLQRSPNLGADTLPIPAPARERALKGQAVYTVERVGQARVLSLLVPLRLGQQTVGVLQVAQSLRQIDRSLNATLLALAGGGLLALLAAARGSLWLAGAALEPIDRVSATAERIMRAADLHQRVPEAAPGDEVGRLTRTINQMLERMERMFAAQQRFTADVAHELRTPLAAMRGNLEILRRGAMRDPEMLAESLRDIESETLRLTRMANDLLALAQADAGTPLRLSTVQLDEIVVEVYRELRPLAGAVEMALELQDQITITGDRDRLKQALINLVANALQHTPLGGAVSIALRREAGRALLVVADTGAGIPPDQLPMLFNRFFRGDRSRARGGAGLGLAIVKWVAEAHGGQITAVSEPGHGATFTLALPLLS